MPTPEQVSAVVERHVEAVNAKDREAFLNNLAENVHHLDPVGAPARVGRDALAEFWDSAIAPARSVTIEPKDVIVCADQACMVATMVVRTPDGSGLTFDFVEVFTVDDHGLACDVRAWWDAARMRPLEG